MSAHFLIAFKGFIGWYMVRSGLDEKTMANTNEPRVSQYRLAMHLGMAFTVFSGLFYSALSHLLVENPVCSNICFSYSCIYFMVLW